MEQQQAAQQEDHSGAEESMQIEEVSLQEGHPGSTSSSQQGDTGGVVGAMMGAAKSLFGSGKHDEQVCLLLLPLRNCPYRYRVSKSSDLVSYPAAMQEGVYLSSHVEQCEGSWVLASHWSRWLGVMCPPVLQQWHYNQVWNLTSSSLSFTIRCLPQQLCQPRLQYKYILYIL